MTPDNSDQEDNAPYHYWILIVDDNYFNIDVLKQMLVFNVPNSYIFSFFSPLKVLESIDQIYTEKPANRPIFDVAFIDISMPELDGYQLTAELKKKFKLIG